MSVSIVASAEFLAPEARMWLRRLSSIGALVAIVLAVLSWSGGDENPHEPDCRPPQMEDFPVTNVDTAGVLAVIKPCLPTSILD